MARKPSNKPWLHGASGWWCATIDGRRKKLDKDFFAACRKLKALRVQAKKGLVGNRDWWDAPFSELADEYLNDVQARKKPATYHSFRYGILRALKVVGTTVRVAELRKFHLAKIEQQMRQEDYSPTTIKDTITTFQGVLNWAVEYEMIDMTPLPKYKKPAALIRNRVITWEEFGSLLRHSDRNFRRFLIALRLTGCRPGELSGLIWEWVDIGQGMWIIPDHKTITRQRQPTPRMIPLPPTVLRICRWLARKPHSGSDHVFLNKLGLPYSKDCLVKKMARLRDRAGIEVKGGEQLVLYNTRIAFGTENAGKVSDIELSALMGHTEVRMTQRYYKVSLERLRDIQRRLQVSRSFRGSVSTLENAHCSHAAAGVSEENCPLGYLPTPVELEAPRQAVS
jgi:integrase